MFLYCASFYRIWFYTRAYLLQLWICCRRSRDRHRCAFIFITFLLSDNQSSFHFPFSRIDSWIFLLLGALAFMPLLWVPFWRFCLSDVFCGLSIAFEYRPFPFSDNCWRVSGFGSGICLGESEFIAVGFENGTI